MGRRTFDHFFVHTKIGTNRKIRRLRRPEHKWCHVAGVLALAAESPLRGHLLIAEGVPATAEDVAEQAGVSVRAADETLKQLRALGILAMDEELGCEYVHDFNEVNPAPKADPTAAERMRRYRARRNGDGRNDRNAVTDATRGSEEKVREEEELQRAPNGALSEQTRPSATERDGDPVYVRLADLLADLIAENRDGRRPKPEHVEKWRRPLRLMVEQDGLTVEHVEGAIRFSQRDTFWRGVILSAANLREHYDKLEAKARASRSGGTRAESMSAVRTMLRQEQEAAA